MKKFFATFLVVLFAIAAIPNSETIAATTTPTRAQFVSALVQILFKADFEPTEIFPFTHSDIPKDCDLRNEAHRDIVWAFTHGIISGNDHHEIQPDRPILTHEAEAIIVKTLEGAAGQSLPTWGYRDQNLPSWAQELRAKFNRFFDRENYAPADAALDSSEYLELFATVDLTTLKENFSEVRTDRWVEVDLDKYMVYLWDNQTVQNAFLVAIGHDATPTYAGEFAITWQAQLRDMRGANLDGSRYVQPDVPWCSYFNGGIAFHGCYWHSNWGAKMSHGCVNMRNEDAKILYEFVSVGTHVLVH